MVPKFFSGTNITIYQKKKTKINLTTDKTAELLNSLDPDEVAHNGLLHQGLPCLPCSIRFLDTILLLTKHTVEILHT